MGQMFFFGVDYQRRICVFGVAGSFCNTSPNFFMVSSLISVRYVQYMHIYARGGKSHPSLLLSLALDRLSSFFLFVAAGN